CHLEPVSSIILPQRCDKDPAPRKPAQLPDCLEELSERSSLHLDLQQRTSLEDLQREFFDIFSCGPSDYGRTELVYHSINRGDHPAIRQLARRLPLAKREEVDSLIDEMKRQDVIEPSSNPWASPVVLVRKKDGSTRFWVDYRRLNDITKKDSYPLPRIDDTLDRLSGAEWFSTLDLRSGYWQVSVHPDDKEKTAFTTGSGLWQFKVGPFVLCNAPATFERLMERTLVGLAPEICMVYIDDIIFTGKTFEQHLSNLKTVLSRLRTAGLKLSPKMCKFFQKETCYLGHVISADGIRTDPSKIRAISTWPVPKDMHELRSFLGLCSYYRRFMKGFSVTAAPLHRLTESKEKFVWTGNCQEAFNKLKEALSSPPVLAYPQPDQPFILDTDASYTGIAAVLSQVQDGQEKVIAYFSKSLSKPECNYCVNPKRASRRS
ncbi:RNA-directed DNA polymerase, partial [Salmonella enterica subsp. enterica serovar Typhimurium]|nr:RNA-directed DNA polymerase [Salmonella enterica subsp. enterica serovar Typhimurium]